MTREQQTRLAAMIRRAADNQGIQYREIAMRAGTTASNLSNAMVCKTAMSEEKWRLACEYVGMDFDAAMADGGEEKQDTPGDPEAAPVVQKPEEMAKPEKKAKEPELIPVRPEEIFTAEDCECIKALIDAHLIADIQANGADFAYVKRVMDLHGKCVSVGSIR